jgi:hypothetical protein
MPFQRIPDTVDVNAKIAAYDGPINGLYTVGNPAAAHAEIGTNGAGQSGIRLYAADGVTVLIDLDALTGDGTFQGDITGSNITGSTLTGGVVQTAASGQRVVLDGASDSIEFYDPAGALVAQLVPNTAGQLNLVIGGSVFRFINGDFELISANLSFLGGQVVGDVTGDLTGTTTGDHHGRCLPTILASSGDVSGTTVEATTGDVTAALSVILQNPPTTGSGTTANAWINTSTGRINKIVSSRRYKKRIRRLRDAWRVMQLRPVTFQDRSEAKADPDARRYWGLIAEEVAEVLPELVTYDAKGRVESVMYDKVGVALLDVVRDINARLERVEATSCA